MTTFPIAPPADDHVLPLAAGRQISQAFDGDAPAFRAYWMTAAGVLVERGSGPKAQEGHEIVAWDLLRGLHYLVRQDTGGGYMLAWGNPQSEQPDQSGRHCYTKLLIMWKDRDGDVPFTVEIEDFPVFIELHKSKIYEDCYQAWQEWQEFEAAVGIDERHKAPVAQGKRIGEDIDWGLQ